MTSKAPRQLDALLAAHIAINLAPGLSGNARRVGGAILGHWNRRTGQCDPSIERLAGMLGIDRATVLRATAELCTGDAALFDKKSHGGKANRAAYAPNWDALRAIVVDWNARMLTGAPAEKVAKVRRTRSQDCDVERRKTATQTYRSNLSKEPDAVSLQPAATLPKPQKKAGRQVPGQGWLLLPLPGTSRKQAAETGAERRVMTAIHDKGSDVYRLVCETATPDMLAEAVDAETRQSGSGAQALLLSVQAARRAG